MKSFSLVYMFPSNHVIEYSWVLHVGALMGHACMLTTIKPKSQQDNYTYVSMKRERL